MTFKERRKRTNSQLIANDFEGIESSFLSFAQELNKKRQAQIIKRIDKVIPELIKAHNKGDSEEVEGILKSLQMPSSKEWRKGINKLVLTSAETGILRAHVEMLRLKELFEFDESWTPDIIAEGYDYDVVLPEDAREYIRKHSYEVGIITEDTVLNRLREELEQGLEEGLSPKEMASRVNKTAGTWMSPWHAETIARTETGKFYNAGRLARWLDPETNGFVEALQYDAILDGRTTEVCSHLDGKVISIEDQATISEYTPPNHFQCRSTWLPITKYEEWESNFDKKVAPEKGFSFKSPLPKLLQGKKEPLIQPKKKFNPLTVTDPDVIRSLNDEDFKTAIGNITDNNLKLSMVTERAEAMVVRENGLKEVVSPIDMNYWGFFQGDESGLFSINSNLDDYKFYMEPSMKEPVSALMKELTNEKDFHKANGLVEAFAEEHGSLPQYADIITMLRIAYDNPAMELKWDGLKAVKRTKEAEALFKIKEPPQTANYKNADSLQQALKDGQSWINKYIDNKLAPSTGVKMRFSMNNTRAYANGVKGTIHFGANERNAGVIVHEAGHVIHWNSPEVSHLVETFFMKRTNNLKLKWGKRHGEDTIPDDFYNYYVGRVYGWEKRKNENAEYFNTNMKYYGQEIFSMGIQAMYQDPMKFYKDDKEHFLFTYAIIRGLF